MPESSDGSPFVGGLGVDADSLESFVDSLDAGIASETQGPPPAPAPFDLDMARAAAGSANRLGFDLYPLLSSSKGNIVVSPAGVAIGLAMATSGARGSTRTAMLRVLHAQALANTEAAFAQLLAAINGRDGHEGNALRLASRIWTQTGHRPSSAFAARLASEFPAPFGELDLLHEPTGACDEIDHWLVGVTQGLSRPDGGACAAAPMALTSAVAFKGNWALPWLSTTSVDFSTGQGQTTRIPMMRQWATRRYAHDGGVAVVECPYMGKLSMLMARPDDGVDLATIESHLAARYSAWLSALAREDSWDVELIAPGWNVTSEYDLRRSLAALGMGEALVGARGDFSGMGGTAGGPVGSVTHVATISVDRGRFAPASTPPPGTYILNPVGRNRNTHFLADRPFLYIVRDNLTSAVLFIGRITEPPSP